MGRYRKSLVKFCFVFMCMTTLTACASREKGNNKETPDNKVTGYTSKEIYDTVSGAMRDMPEMDTITSDNADAKSIFMIFSELEYDKVEDFVISYSKVGLADEVIVVHTKSNKDVQKLKEDLEERLNTRKETFEEYNPEEQSKFKGACVLVQDNCVVMLIGNQAQNGKYEFDKLFDK